MISVLWYRVVAVYCLLLLGVFAPGMLPAQTFKSDHIGITAGVSMSLGNKVQRLGISVNSFVRFEMLQANGAFRWFYNFKSLGPGLPGWERQWSAGGVLGFGGSKGENHEFLSPVSNQTGRTYSIAYAYNFYKDQIGTSQPSATLGIEIGDFQIASENDIFAALQDHFRTGGLMIAYVIDDTRIGLNTTMWHGEAYGRNVKRYRNTDYPSRFGYFDLSEAQYGKYSNGLLSVRVEHVRWAGQVMQADLGIDAEQVRHWFQNWLIHDAYYIPKSWFTYKNPHYPMLDKDGEPYLFKEGQKIRPVSLYYNVGLNGGLFY